MAWLDSSPPWSPGSDDPNVQARIARAPYPARLADRSLATLFTAPRATSVTGAAVATDLRHNGYDWRPLLSALPVVVLVIHGERDLLPLAASHELVDSLATSAKLVVIPGSGHMPFWEAPQRFFALIDSFLSTPAQEWVPP